jgi:sterol desaturase/sphingolipid hydroxylase (fatty acid hydroxylase superfamily)
MAVQHKASALNLVGGSLAGWLGALIGAQARNALGGSLIHLTTAQSNGIFGAVGVPLLSAFCYDFFYYWFHRLQHRYPALWAIHVVHHLGEGINVSTPARHHWLEIFARIPTVAIPMTVLLDVPPTSGIVLGMLLLAQQVFNHANMKVRFGHLSWIFTGTQLHRIHHSRFPEHRDKNFAAAFPIFDVLFGTYYHPHPNEFPPTGVEGEPDVRNVWQASMLPFRAWRNMISCRSRLNV